MDIMIFTGMLLLGGLVNFIKELDTKSVSRIAGIYIFIVMVTVAYTWIFFFAGMEDPDLFKVLSIFLQIIGVIVHGTLGYLAAYIALNFHPLADRDDHAALYRIIRLTLRAISISIANSFIAATVGKSLNMPYMSTFFIQSGYTSWFLYLVMAAESLGAFGILVHFKLKTGYLAAGGLIIIMLGAIYTHLHNHDPFSESYARSCSSSI